MADKKKVGSEPIVLGKKWSGEKFVTVRSAETIAADAELQKQYEDKNAITLAVYYSIRRINDPVKQAMMDAYTKVRKATAAAFDEIFAAF